MTRIVHGATDIGQPAGHSRRRLVVHHHHRFDLVRSVAIQTSFDQRRIDTGPPVTRYAFHIQTESLRHASPEHSKVTRLKHEDPIAGRQSVDNCRLPSPRPRSWKDDYRIRRLENGTNPLKHLVRQLSEFRTAVVYHRGAHGTENPVRHVGRAGDLQEVATSMNHGISTESCICSSSDIMTLNGTQIHLKSCPGE